MHIGRRIQQELADQGRSVTWFAAQLCYTRTHVYKIFTRQSIDTQLLWRVSQVLGHDFFSELSREYGELSAK